MANKFQSAMPAALLGTDHIIAFLLHRFYLLYASLILFSAAELITGQLLTNLLGPKIRELISLAVAVTVRCDGCITVHAEAAARHGASREEIAEALGVATAVNAGAALVYSTRALDAYEQVTAAR